MKHADDDDCPRWSGFERPSLLQDLQNILLEYPDDGQILKEMLQNAEDAGAQVLKIVSGTTPEQLSKASSQGKRKSSSNKRRTAKAAKAESAGQEERLTETSSQEPPWQKVFSEPGLCVYNDAYFTEEDWRGIHKLHDSVKVKDPLKVGRFGLGFKSVFHITDHPVIISGSRILFMDPFREEKEAIYTMPVINLTTEERQALHHALFPLLKVLAENSLTDEKFKGTVFWFPLRQKPSELSKTIYTMDRVQQLKKSLQNEMGTMLLFLKSIEKIEVYSYDSESSLSKPELDFSVSLGEKCLQKVRQDRQKFLSNIKTTSKACPRNETAIWNCLSLDICQRVDGRWKKVTEHWIVVHYHQGIDDMSSDLWDLCQRKTYKHRPYAGVAAKLNSQPELFEGQLFCFLPLPPEVPSPTGLPVHVHGFFELSKNRRHVKWPTSGLKTEDSGPSDEALEWNMLLVQEVVPRAYTLLLERQHSEDGSLICQTPGQASMLSMAEFLYKLCPDPEKVTNHWQPLLSPLYQRLATRSLFFTPVRGGHWLPVHDTVLMVTSVSDPTKPEVEAALEETYQVCQANFVRLPSHVMSGLKTAGKATQQALKMVCPQNLSEMMKQDNSWPEHLSPQQKHFILLYLVLHGDCSLLEDLPLLPLADGSFCSHHSQKVYVCRDEQDVHLLPGLQHQLCFVNQPKELQGHLQQLASKEFGDLTMINNDNFPKLLQQSLEKKHLSLSNITISKDDAWIRQVWNYLQDQNLESFDHLPLLPCPSDKVFVLRPLQGNYVCKRLKGFPQASQTLSTALGYLGVHVVYTLPDFVLRHTDIIHTRVQPPTCFGLQKALATLSKQELSGLEAVINTFNTDSTSEERFALVDSLVEGLGGNSIEQDKHWEKNKTILCCLKVFPVWPSCCQSPEDNRVGKKRKRLPSAKEHFQSAQANSHMIPNVNCHDLPPPVSFLPKLLHCHSQSLCRLALALGVQEVSVHDHIADVLTRLSDDCQHMSSDEVMTFMIYFLQSIMFKEQELIEKAKNIPFIPSNISGKLFKAEELYDPENKLLQELFADDDRFPLHSFYQGKGSVLQNLKQLGLRDDRTVISSHLINAATGIDKLCKSVKSDHRNAEKKAKALWDFLQKHDQDSSVIQELACLRCLPCISTNSAVSDYPKSVPVCPKDYSALGIARAVDMCDFSHHKLVGSVRPVSVSAENGSSAIHIMFYQPTSDDIMEHMQTVISKFSRQQSQHFKAMLHLIYSRLNQEHDNAHVHDKMKNMECIFVNGTFQQPSKFWFQGEDTDDVILSPYRFPLPSELVEAQLVEFFVACGCSQQQTPDMLRQVLEEIEAKSLKSACSQDFKREKKLVLKILHTLKEMHMPGNGDTLLPVYSGEENVMRFKKAKECTVSPDPDAIQMLAEEEEAMFFVDPCVDSDIALELGALDYRKRMTSGVDELDIEDTSFGQNEELTTRLNGLLRNGYTDGFSVPKELVQNADDAGAKVVKFLLDERQNRQWRTGLLTSDLSDFQGPALWVYNDAQFSDMDFANLCKLGGATKREDGSKVGRFGLGFNASYNITDLPSLYSGSTLAMLDPHETRVSKGKRGTKINFKDPMNKILLKRMPNQFRPFQGVFSCDILNKHWKPFLGTLFRFPFRTETQARKSKICSEAFSKNKRQDFVNCMMDRSGNLMLFLQHVTSLELHHLSSSTSDPSQTVCNMVTKRTSEFITSEQPVDNCGILDHFSAWWKSAAEEDFPLENLTIVERVALSVQVSDADRGIKKRSNSRQDHRQSEEAMMVDTEEKQQQFCVAWSTGSGKTCQLAREKPTEGFVPLAAVAVAVDDADGVMSMENCPSGFYETGHLFCFLPLAIEVADSVLHVHINAPFVLTPDRRGLVTQIEDDSSLVDGRWNMALFSDPIPRAYLAALASVAQKQTRDDLYYSLWPKWSEQPANKASSLQSALFPSFYQLMVEEDAKVFLHPGGSVSFSNSHFFDPEFKKTETGRVAFEVLKKFWNTSRWRLKQLVDLPSEIAESIKASPQRVQFIEKVIRKEEFFKFVLFPKIKENDPNLESQDRNLLVLYALLSESELLQELVRNHHCIPCAPDGRLKCPSHLVHPSGHAAPLFAEDDGRFPKCEGIADFTSTEALCQLMNLGMIKDKMDKEDLVERAKSVKKISSNIASQRVSAIVKYLTYLGDACYARCLIHVPFLPVLQKPLNWPLPWCGENQKFTKPSQVFAKELKELIGCKAVLLDDNHLDLSSQDKKTLEQLGATIDEAKAGSTFTKLTVDNLLCICCNADKISKKFVDTVGKICEKHYKYLNSLLKGRETTRKKEDFEVLQTLQSKAVVWTDGRFHMADSLAFGTQSDLKPYLTTLESSLQKFRKIFSFLGVAERFSVKDIVGALKQIGEDKRSSKLRKADIDLIYRIANLLSSTLEMERGDCLCLDAEDVHDLYLPGKDCLLHSVNDLCLDDCEWLQESDTMCFLHRKFSKELADMFHVKSKREHDEEKLTTRINRLLEGYTRNASIFKELLQNADDAGASEVRFVKDWRQHSTEKLLTEGWKEVFGPALCVFNNSCFTTSDMKGIQALGEGSKEGEAMKTGKYGVGFNAVYNLTDTPCFLTTVVPSPEEATAAEVKEKESEKLCVFDPNFFLVSKRLRLPGQSLSVTSRFKEQYPDMLAPFFVDDTMQADRGTVFRLPLRTEKNAQKSNIEQPAVTMEEVDRLLREFQPVMGECLLFLNSVKKVSVYTAREDGTFDLEYETSLSYDDRSEERKKEFLQHVHQEVKKMKNVDEKTRLVDLSAKEVAVQCHLSDSIRKEEEEWLIVHRFGLTNKDKIPEQLQNSLSVHKHRLLPLGGVAFCMSPSNLQDQHLSSAQSPDQIFHKRTGRQRGKGLQPTMQKEIRPGGHGKKAQGRVVSFMRGPAGTLQETEELEESSETQKRTFRAYCLLPLPVTTGLPVHVNARFALDHETRCNIITDDDNNLLIWNSLLADEIIVPAYIKALHEVKQLCFSVEKDCLSENNTQDLDRHGRKKKIKRTSAKKKQKTQSSANRCLLTSKDLDWKLEHYSNFFPDHKDKRDVFWQNLVKSLYQQVAQTEANIFPAVRLDLDRLIWVPARKSKGFPGYFWGLDNLPQLKSLPQLKRVLMSLNMNIISCPFRIFESLTDFEVKDVRKVEEDTVIEFLLSCQCSDSDTDSCNLKNLPQPVQNTTFCTVENVETVLQFIHGAIRDLQNLPLCLTMSERLHCFAKESQTIASVFCDLLPGSSERFLHKRLNEFVIPHRQRYLRELDIVTLVELLPHTLDQSVWGCGGQILMDEAPFSPSQITSTAQWIRRMWQCLETWKHGNLEYEMYRLQDWSLLPTVRDGKLYLFPLKDRNCVVHIFNRVSAPTFMSGQDMMIREEHIVNEYLTKLPVNKLHTKSLPAPSVATQIVASVKNPERLLMALCNSSLQQHMLSSAEAETILHFLFTRVDCCYSASSFRSLPFFERPDGTLTTAENVCIVLPAGVPRAGLNDWSSNRGISLVKNKHHFECHYRKLGIIIPKEADFYISYLLPNISDLKSEDVVEHMRYMKTHLMYNNGALAAELHRTQFITGYDGTLCKASDFYSPDCKVFKVMLTQDRFPPSPYDTLEWRSFLKSIGMVCEVSEELFLTFARQIADARKKNLSEAIKQQSEELSYCLKTSKRLREEDFLRKLKNIKFLLPQSPMKLECGATLQKIHQVFTPSTPLVSFSEGCSSKHVFLVWTSCCIFSTNADPAHFDAWTPDMNEWIGFNSQPSPATVIKHVKTVCESLTLKRKDGTSLLTEYKTRELDAVEEIMRSIYHCLKTLPDCHLEDLHEVAIIFDKGRKAMFSPCHVVLTALDEQKVEGYVVNAPEKFGEFFDLFGKLGVSKEATAQHYVLALEQIHSVYLEEILNPNDLELVSRAMHLLFDMLKKPAGVEGVNLPNSTLYLPAVNINLLKGNPPQVKLVDSRQLILEVNQHQLKRIKTPVQNLLVFIGFFQLGLKGHDLNKEAKMLPECCKMKEWRDVVKEELEESCQSLAREDIDTRLLTDLLHSDVVTDVVKRLVNHEYSCKGSDFTEDDVKKIEEGLKSIRVFTVTNLRTVLYARGEELPSTMQEEKFFIKVEKKDTISGQQSTNRVSVYIDSHQDKTLSVRNSDLQKTIHKAVSQAVGFKFDSVLDACLTDLPNAQSELDKEGITPLDRQQVTVFPPPGSFVPEEMHHLLDHDVYEYKVQEYVAYEVYDPVLESLNMDYSDEERVMEDESSDSKTDDTAGHGCTESDQKKKPMYIFAKVIRVIQPESEAETDGLTRLMQLSYVIDVGEEEYKKVEASQLYKFIRPSLNVLVPITGVRPHPQPEAGDDLKKVLKDIRAQLQEIWNAFHDRNSRHRAVKRLLMKWHPDKNPGREEFCTKVFQQIQWYVELLNEGKQLPSDDEDHVDGYTSEYTRQNSPNRSYGRRHRRSGRSGFFRQFFDDIYCRGQTYASSSSSYYSSNSGNSGTFYFTFSGSQSVPQPEEGHRWMRQVVQDLKTARLTLLHGEQGSHNWTCYQAHQAAEKALKAFLYLKNGNHGMKNSHDISCLAGLVGDGELRTSVDQLSNLVKFHTRMRYPDILEFPKIPSDIYTESMANQACDLAETIVKKAKDLMDKYRPPSPHPQPAPQPPPSSSRPTPPSVSKNSRRDSGHSLRSSVRRQAVTSRADGPAPKVPRLDPPMKALPPP